MKKIILAFIFVLFFSNSFSQKKNDYFFKTIVFGSSITYIWDNYNNHIFQEYTWNVNGAISLHKQLFLGVQVLTIFNSSIKNDWNNFYMYGLFGQFDFFPKQKFRLFIETSINNGNYCTCSNLDPYLKNNLLYIGFGLGSDIPLKFLSDKLFLDISFYNYLILNKIKTKYNYTQYIIGINYHFGKKIK